MSVRWIRIVLVLLTVVSLSACGGSSMKEITYAETAYNVSARQPYIDQIVKKIGRPKYVRSVRYNPSTPQGLGLLSRPGGFTAAVRDLPLSQYEKEQVPVEIFVYTPAFAADTEEEFISLIEHEYRHGEQFYYGKILGFPFSFFHGTNGEENRQLWNAVRELDAYGIQINSRVERSRRSEVALKGFYLMYYEGLWETSGSTEPKFIEDLKIGFFEPWMTEVFIEQPDGRYRWVSVLPENLGKVYELSPHEVSRIRQKSVP